MGISFCQDIPLPHPLTMHACTQTFSYARKSICVLQSQSLSSLCCDRQVEAVYSHIKASWMDMDLLEICLSVLFTSLNPFCFGERQLKEYVEMYVVFLQLKIILCF